MALSLEDLRSFIKLHESLNMTRASELLGVSQPALSYSLKKIEQEIGGELFIRLKNGLRPTKLGEELFSRAYKMLGDWESLSSLVCPDSSEVKRPYTIAVHISVAQYTLSKALVEVFDYFPKINLRLIHGPSNEMTDKVINWQADFSIAVNPAKHPDLVMKKICDDEVCFFMSAKGNKEKLLFDPSMKQAKDILKRKKGAPFFTSEVQSSCLEVLARMASEGLGVAILPARVAALFPELKKIKAFPSFQDKVYLIYRLEKHKDATGKSIVKLLRNSLS